MKIIMLSSSFKEKTITLNKSEIGYFEIINNHISHLKFTKEKETNKIVVLKFKTTSDYIQAFRIISEKEK